MTDKTKEREKVTRFVLDEEGNVTGKVETLAPKDTVKIGTGSKGMIKTRMPPEASLVERVKIVQETALLHTVLQETKEQSEEKLEDFGLEEFLENRDAELMIELENGEEE